MAVCCSSGEGYLGTNLISCRSRNVDFEVKGLRFKLRPTPESCLFSKVTVLVTALRSGKGNLCFGKRKLNAEIRSELQPSAEVNSGRLDLSSLKESGDVSVKKVSGNIESDDRVDLDHGSGSMDFPSGSGGNGKFPPGGGGGDDGDNSDDYKEEEFGPLLKYEEVIKEVEARGASLPSDMLEAAKANLLVGVVVNVALVGMLAPYVRFGQTSTSNSLLGRVARAYGALPSRAYYMVQLDLHVAS
ncbi:hypothetical protein B296_00034124 [Ensete ventricosum]|uniref:Uncharacterized protein n=1 Tax=Ensete ventricosum TaxID=4639 RepID=A0A427A272_ENSVE|nr:hypothetical protein B296_00034124 [Ensete ventricosum]